MCGLLQSRSQADLSGYPTYRLLMDPVDTGLGKDSDSVGGSV